MTLKTTVADQLRELQLCRQRLEDITSRFRRDHIDGMPSADRLLLPEGVTSIEAAIVGLQTSISTADMRAFDKLLQAEIEREFNALFNVCLSSVSMLGNLQQTIEDQAKTFLSDRLGDKGLERMFFGRFSGPQRAGEALHTLYEQANPPVRLFGAERTEAVILAGPPMDSDGPLRALAENVLPERPAAYVPVADEIAIYREFCRVALSSLPQLGPIGEDAYNDALDAQGGSPHCRTDVQSWQDVEVS
jgi:hypothetical protein